tara:strand:+ start:539 stop:778 length:240 start_codon:yes stop_codon:yes gene_type:complete
MPNGQEQRQRQGQRKEILVMAMSVKHYFKSGKEHKGGLHKMTNGKLHSGKTHTSSSKPLFHYGELSKTSQNKARKSWNV